MYHDTGTALQEPCHKSCEKVVLTSQLDLFSSPAVHAKVGFQRRSNWNCNSPDYKEQNLTRVTPLSSAEAGFYSRIGFDAVTSGCLPT